MDIEQFRKNGYAAVDAICAYYEGLQDRPVKSAVEPGYLIESLPHSAPTHGESFETIAADFQSLILPGITHWQHGRFFAYFPAISTFESMLGELYAASVSNPGFNWICSPACTELEQVVMDWMVNILGLGDTFLTKDGHGGGIIMGSASESALTAAMAAREHALRFLSSSELDPAAKEQAAEDIPHAIRDTYSPKLVMYGSTQTHSLGAKAALLLGMTWRALPVKASDDYALTGATLQNAIEKDVAQGFVPFFVIATVGTTSSGAVDRIAEIGEVLKSFPTALLHIDAAWAGVAYALPEQRAALRLDELNQYADTFCTNAHKWGLVGFDCSLFYVRDRRNLTEAFDVTPAFLRSKEGDAGTVIDYRNWQIALGRRFRSIKLWFVLRSFGVEGFQKHLRDGISQAEALCALIKQSPNFSIVTPPSLTLVVVRLDMGLSDVEANLLNQRLHTRLTARHDVMLTQTVLHSAEREVYCLRIALGGRNTTMSDVKDVWRIVELEAAAVVNEWNAQHQDRLEENN